MGGVGGGDVKFQVGQLLERVYAAVMKVTYVRI